MTATFSSPGVGPAGNPGSRQPLHTNLEQALKTAQKLHKEVNEVNRVVGQSSSRLSYSMPPTPPPSYGGNPNIPGAPRSAAPDNGGHRSMWDQAKRWGSATMAFLPSAAAGVERQQRTFYGGVAVGDYNLGVEARKNAMTTMRGTLTSVNADVRMNEMMMRAGWNQQSQMQGVYGVASFGARMLGMENEVAAGAHMATVGNVGFQNAGLISGVQVKDAQGNALTGIQLWQNIYNRFIRPYYEGKKGGKDAFLRAMQPGRGLDQNSMIAAMDPQDRANFQTWVVNKLSGQKTGTPGEANDAMKNPAVSAMGLTGAENQRVETSMGDSVRGYVYANQGLEKFSGALDAAYKALGPFTASLQMLSGAMLAASQSMLGQSTMGAADAILDRATDGSGVDGGDGPGGRRGRTRTPWRNRTGRRGKIGRFGAKAASKLGKYVPGFLKTGGKGITKFGGKLLSKVGGKMIPGLGLVLGGYQGYQSSKSGEGFWGGLGSSILGGAAAGGILGAIGGGGIGAIPGALLGGLGGAVSHTIGYGLGQLGKNKEQAGQDEFEAYDSADAGEAETGLVDSWGTTTTETPPETRAKGAWKISKPELAKLHENEMVLPADVAESFRSAVQNHLTMGEGNKDQTQKVINIDVTLNNASWSEAQKLIKMVKDSIKNDDELVALGSL